MYARVTLGVTGIISIWRWAKNATNVSLHGCIFAIKHYFDKSLEFQPLLHVLCCKKCSRSFKILQLQRLGINSHTHTHTHELIAITLRLRARVNNIIIIIIIITKNQNKKIRKKEKKFNNDSNVIALHTCKLGCDVTHCP